MLLELNCFLVSCGILCSLMTCFWFLKFILSEFIDSKFESLIKRFDLASRARMEYEDSSVRKALISYTEARFAKKAKRSSK